MARLELSYGPVTSDFILAVATGQAEEVAAFSPRGEGKTWAALGAMIAHAQKHQETGHALPVLWAGVTDTFQSHKDKTVESLLAPGWHGAWELADGGHEARCTINGQLLVRLRLFGVEDRGAMNRLRRECHAVWFEEPAPAQDISGGVNEDAWAMVKPSARLKSHCNPLMLTSNYPDLEHWTWQRFAVRQHPGSVMFRVPRGENPYITEEQRAKWAMALEGRPDLRRRLLDGEPGMVLLGEQVAAGFRFDAHVVTGKRLAPVSSEPLVIGQDGGASHTWCSTIGQRVDGRVRVYASILSDQAGARQHLDALLPWLGEHAPWILEGRGAGAVVAYDQAMNSDDPGDAESNPLRTFRAKLPARYVAAPVTWAGRLNPMLALFNLMHEGRPVLEIDSSCTGLISALNGGWYYPQAPGGGVSRDLPKKPNHPHEDYGDAFAYLVAHLAPTRSEASRKRPATRATTYFNPLRYGAPGKR